MSKKIFSSYKDAMEFSKKLIVTNACKSRVHREGSGWCVEVDNKSALYTPQNKKVVRKPSELSDEKRELFEKLKSWRKDKADSENLRPYMIVTDAQLIQILEIPSPSIDMLLTISGFGNKRIDKYGDEIISICDSATEIDNLYLYYDSCYDPYSIEYQIGLYASGYSSDGLMCDKYFSEHDSCYIENYDKDGFDKDGFDKNGFNAVGIHKLTQNGFAPDGYDVVGFNAVGIHKLTQNRFSPDGYDCDFYDKDGYDYSGLDRKGFNKTGINCDTNSIYDEDGFDINGFNIRGEFRTGYYRKSSFQIENGYNREGFDKTGIHKDTGTKFDKFGYDMAGFDKDGYHKSYTPYLGEPGEIESPKEQDADMMKDDWSDNFDEFDSDNWNEYMQIPED